MFLIHKTYIHQKNRNTKKARIATNPFGEAKVHFFQNKHMLTLMYCMKKIFLLAALTLTACSSVPQPYSEIQLPIIKPGSNMYGSNIYEEVDKTLAPKNWLSRKGTELPIDVLQQSVNPSTSLQFCQQYVSVCPENSLCQYCQIFKGNGHTFVGASSGALNTIDGLANKYNSTWSFFDGKTKLFSTHMSDYADGAIDRVEIVNGKPAITFSRPKRHLPTNVDSDITSDVFYDGMFFNEHFHVDASHEVFLYKGKIGFIGEGN